MEEVFFIAHSRRGGGLPRIGKAVDSAFFTDPKEAIRVCDKKNSEFPGVRFRVYEAVVSVEKEIMCEP